MIYRRRYPEVVEAFRFGIQHEPSWFTDAVKEGRVVITNSRCYMSCSLL